MPTLAIKLGAVLALCLSGLGALPQAGVCFLLALLDAAQTVPPPTSEKPSSWLPEFLGILGQWITARVWPFYVGLWLILGLPQLLPGDPAAPPAGGLAASRAWNGAHQAGTGGRCACGKPMGHPQEPFAKSSPPSLSPQETMKRIEALKQRSLQGTLPKAK
jgi:hypothetical protein